MNETKLNKKLASIHDYWFGLASLTSSIRNLII